MVAYRWDTYLADRCDGSHALVDLALVQVLAGYVISAHRALAFRQRRGRT